MLYKTFLPHLIDLEIEAKLSSNTIISATYLVTSVPVTPIENPISAFLRAGASLVPSPVIATTSPISFKAATSKYLSYGLHLANTLSLCQIFLNSYKYLTPSFT
jgi:hypothetical protein